MLIMCSCNINVWKKLRSGSVAVSHQQNRQALDKDIVICLWPYFAGMVAFSCNHFLIYVCFLPVQRKFYYMANVFNYSNSFINPAVYALRIHEFRKALHSSCFGRQPFVNTLCTNIKKITKVTNDFSHELACEQDVIETKLLMTSVKPAVSLVLYVVQ